MDEGLVALNSGDAAADKDTVHAVQEQRTVSGIRRYGRDVYAVACACDSEGQRQSPGGQGHVR